jgi:hypothetical protein
VPTFAFAPLEVHPNGSISPNDQHVAIDPFPLATVDSGRTQKVKYLPCSSQTPGGLEDGQK